jgi:peptide deformylase
MAVREVIKMGNPLLLQVAAEVREFDTPQLDSLVTDLFDTMNALDGAGLAAPQIGVGLRVVIFGVEANPRYPEVEAVPSTVLINPRITVLRYKRIRYSGFDQHGASILREVDGFHARVVQHECDHLDGVLYPRRIRDMRMFGFEQELFRESSEAE